MLSKKELEKYKNIDFTPDVLRQFKSFEHLTDEEAEEVLAALNGIAHLAVEMYQQGIGVEEFLEDYKEED